MGPSPAKPAGQCLPQQASPEACRCYNKVFPLRPACFTMFACVLWDEMACRVVVFVEKKGSAGFKPVWSGCCGVGQRELSECPPAENQRTGLSDVRWGGCPHRTHAMR